jgi:rhodanese-related sulfurtransferase
MAGFVAENLVTGKLMVTYWNDPQLFESDSIIIDVRTTEEYSKEHIDGAINIPVDTLRQHLWEIPQNKPVFIYCQIGLRGYLAQRILLQNNFTRVKNLSGGYLLWNQVQKELALLN